MEVHNMIITLKDLISEFRKKSADFIKCLKKDKQPIILTLHGKSAAVLVDVSVYQQMVNKLELMEELLEAKQQIERGAFVSHDEAKKRIEEHLGKWK